MNQDQFEPIAFWEARLERFDLVSVGYSSLGLPYNRWLYRLRASVFRRMLRRYRTEWSGIRVLDVGSGTGFYVREWLRVGADVVGSDLTETAVSKLRQTYPDHEFARLDISDGAAFAAESFEAISAFDVLFHIVDDERYAGALEAISSLLRPGGLFFYSDNFVHGSSVRIAHQVSRPLDEIERQLDALGLEVIERRPMFVLMNAPIDTRSQTLRTAWGLFGRLLSLAPALGAPLGALLYPIERALVGLLRESPSTELMVCRKRATVS